MLSQNDELECLSAPPVNFYAGRKQRKPPPAAALEDGEMGMGSAEQEQEVGAEQEEEAEQAEEAMEEVQMDEEVEDEAAEEAVEDAAEDAAEVEAAPPPSSGRQRRTVSFAAATPLSEGNSPHPASAGGASASGASAPPSASRAADFATQAEFDGEYEEVNGAGCSNPRADCCCS